ncbi:hypothetical protein BJ508DRAFT_309948 [Ascobolus immersus RN42]|uniref:Uncharacterized protein n=1 Tax=Ascobolus immersus RN42 TaxID=1160509 RepID=A0A3N4HVM5_ASCIM|nr:hypothetical protein BJ508DRAFT_309948 [Ascobolus immersus RN42]
MPRCNWILPSSQAPDPGEETVESLRFGFLAQNKCGNFQPQTQTSPNHPSLPFHLLTLDMRISSLINQEEEPQQPQEELPDTSDSEQEASIVSDLEEELEEREDEEEEADTTKNGSGGSNRRWSPLKKHALLKETLAINPYDAPRGHGMLRWDEVAVALTAQGFPRTDKAWINEPVSQYIQDMEDVLALASSTARDPELQKEARDKIERLNKEGD